MGAGVWKAWAVTHPPIIVVAAALVDDLTEPRLLLAARRRSPTQLAGRWEFPGGKVDPGETPVEALHRELREELGVAVELGPEVVGPDDGAWRLSTRYTMRLWLARVADGEPAPLVEHDELRWLEAGAWLSVPWLDADVRIVGSLTAMLDRSGPDGPPARGPADPAD